MFLTQAELAEAFGVTTRAIQKWQNEGMPLDGMYGVKNQYDLQKCVEWYVKKRVGNDLQYEKTRLTKAQADKTELEAQLVKRELLRAENVAQVWQSQIIAFRSRILSLPTKLSPDILQAQDLTEAKAILENALHEALKEFREVDLEEYA